MNYPPEIIEFLQAYDRLLLDERGIIKLLPADFYRTLDYTDLRVWCICRAIYQLPTVELIEKKDCQMMRTAEGCTARSLKQFQLPRTN